MPAYHQMELAEQLVTLLGVDNFRLGILSPLSDERLKMSWRDDYSASYLLRFSNSEAEQLQIKRWIESADVVIQGRFPIKYLRKRVRAGKLTFAYQERFWKRKKNVFRLIRRLPHLYKNYWSVDKDNYHLLAAGAYAGEDLQNLGLFKNRAWKFGYFIDAKPSQTLSNNKPPQLSFVWCARMIDCKRPEQALTIARHLKDKGVDFHLTMIGHGDLFVNTQAKLEDLALKDCVSLVGSKTVDEVNAIMAHADVMLMTSDFREGWGLVVNEAINNQCFPVINDAAGAAKWLVDPRYGMTYNDQQFDLMLEQLSGMCHDPAAVRKAALMGQKTLNEAWSSEVAAQRIIELSQHLLEVKNNEDHNAPEGCGLFSDGPCSAV